MRRAPRHELRVAVDLAGADIDGLRASILGRARGRTPGVLAREEEIVRAALEYARGTAERASLDFIRARLQALETVVEMLLDKDWTLPGSVHRRILATLDFMIEPAGLVPDRTPVFGNLDEAVLAEILCFDIRHELDGYRDFRRFRESATRSLADGVSADGALLERRLAAHRKRLRARIQERQHRAQNGGAALRRLLSALRLA